MIISVASGKGGTGKTTVATSLALSAAEDVELLDCDVEEPNAQIFIKATISSKKTVTISVPQIDVNKCTLCGKCAKVCAFNAIAIIPNKVLVFPELCHSCGACQYLCPVKAISEIGKKIGVVEIGQKKHLKFVQGQLNIGEATAIPVIKGVKTHIMGNNLVIIDAPPGTSCPMIEATKDSDFCLLVTEPTPFGLNDLILAVEVLQKLQIPFGIILNRCDLGNQDVYNYCKTEGIPILMTIPFQKEIAIAYSNGIPLVEISPKYKEQFRDILEKIRDILIAMRESQ
jgi:MinD superfamily P-loop ATPase